MLLFLGSTSLQPAPSESEIARRRESRASTPIARSQSEEAQTSIDQSGSTVLGNIVSRLVRLEAVSRDRPAQNSDWMASEAVSTLLDQTLQTERREGWSQ